MPPRSPPAKAVTTLDVLSEGRAWLDIGAGSSEEEADGLGLPFPRPGSGSSDSKRRCRSACRCGATTGPYAGKHYRLARTLNSPQPLTRPHPPILIGGGGEKKTLRLVAQYAQACNLFAGPDLPRKRDVLRAHCDTVGLDYHDITKTVSGLLDPRPRGEHVNRLIGRMRELAKLGINHYLGPVPNIASITPFNLLAAASSSDQPQATAQPSAFPRRPPAPQHTSPHIDRSGAALTPRRPTVHPCRRLGARTTNWPDHRK